jgi:hypothetical protein
MNSTLQVYTAMPTVTPAMIALNAAVMNAEARGSVGVLEALQKLLKVAVRAAR